MILPTGVDGPRPFEITVRYGRAPARPRYFVRWPRSCPSPGRRSGQSLQPALSKQIRLLERPLRGDLSRGTLAASELTEAGEVLLEPARDVLERWDVGVAVVNDAAGRDRRVLSWESRPASGVIFSGGPWPASPSATRLAAVVGCTRGTMRPPGSPTVTPMLRSSAPGSCGADLVTKVLYREERWVAPQTTTLADQHGSWSGAPTSRHRAPRPPREAP